MSILKFKPLLVPTIWGGSRIAQMKGLQGVEGNIGESWEISGVPGRQSVVSEGPYAGLALNDVLAIMRADLLGKDNYAACRGVFPILIKYIDAKQNLSVQVHPSNDVAERQGKGYAKTEMWYAMQSTPNAKLISGLRRAVTPEEYAAMAANSTILDALAEHDVHEGDCFFIPGGRIHSAGAGCFLAEIQQTSETTYRIYDYDRRDSHGQPRELHIAEAAECIDFRVHSDYRTHYRRAKNEAVPLVDCDYFHTALYNIDEPMLLDYSDLDSFVVLMGVAGEGSLIDDNGNETSLKTGETVLIPACEQWVRVEGTVRFLEVFA